MRLHNNKQGPWEAAELRLRSASARDLTTSSSVALLHCAQPRQPQIIDRKSMKSLITLLLACAPLFGAETDLRVFSTAGTNAVGSYAKDVFTRGGQTNLMRVKEVGPKGVIWIHRFYHAGQLVGNFVSFVDKESTFNTEATSYCMSLRYGPTGEILSAKIGDRNGRLLDAFSYTNGVFTPVDRALIEREHDVGPLMKPKFSPEWR